MLKEYWEIVRKAKENPRGLEALVLNDCAQGRPGRYKYCDHYPYEVVVVLCYKRHLKSRRLLNDPEEFEAEWRLATVPREPAGEYNLLDDLFGCQKRRSAITAEEHPELIGIVKFYS